MEDILEGDRAEGDEHEHDRQAQADVADPVDDERLLRRGGRAGLGLPETDEQVGGQADALPADVEQQVVICQDQDEHDGDEQVEEAEELASVRVVRHVAE